MSNIKIGPKLIVSFLFIAALTAFMGIFLINGFMVLSRQTATIYEKGAVPLGIFVKTADDMQGMRLEAYRWRLAKTPESAETS